MRKLQKVIDREDIQEPYRDVGGGEDHDHLEVDKTEPLRWYCMEGSLELQEPALAQSIP